MRVNSHVRKILIPAISIAGIFILIVSFFPAFRQVLQFMDDFYLRLAEKVSNGIFRWSGSGFVFKDNQLFIDHQLLGGFVPETLYKKLTLFVIIIIGLTKVPLKSRLWFGILVLISDYLLMILHLVLGAFFVQSGFPLGDNHLFPAVSYTFAQLWLVSLLFLWIRRNRGRDFYFLSTLKIYTFQEKKRTELFIVVYLYIIIGSFLLSYFQFTPWINFLFEASQQILTRTGYYATVEPSLLIGDNGSIYMAKACLGIRTMLLFASVVYLTGNDNKRRWFYILFGIIFLNIVNIIRFVLLFIHIQKYGGYELSIDLHDMYDYITYTLVFILWVVWFEKYSDIKMRSGDQKGVIEKDDV